MDLLLDTNVLVWLLTGDRRLTSLAQDAIFHPGNQALVSSATACEYVDLNARGRFGSDLPFHEAIDLVSAKVVPLPETVWIALSRLPDIHRDPVDRMVVAHAIASGMTLITSDERMRTYPVRTIW